MNLSSLKYLVALAEHRHFAKAAAACFVSQPTLSMQIKKLKTELNVQLLERTNKSVVVTEIGRLIVEHARTILQELTIIQQQANILSDPYGGQIRLGIIPTLAPYLLPYIMPKLSKAFPRLKYYLVELQTEHLLEKLRTGEIDCAILALPVLNKQLVVAPLFKEEFLLAVPTKHPLAACQRIASADLHQQPLLLLEEGHCLREQALELCQHLQATEAEDFRATSLETLRQMVAAGMGITLMPKLACGYNQGIRYISFARSHRPFRSLGLVWRQTTAKTALLKQLAKLVAETIKKAK